MNERFCILQSDREVEVVRVSFGSEFAKYSFVS
jgi:hypothetical protein